MRAVVYINTPANGKHSSDGSHVTHTAAFRHLEWHWKLPHQCTVTHLLMAGTAVKAVHHVEMALNTC